MSAQKASDVLGASPAEWADPLDAVPWFTDQHAREAAERMKTYAADAGHVPQLAASVLSDAEWLNLARVALELRPR